MGRFVSFTDAELLLLWDGLCVDDGVRYGLTADDPEYPLAVELRDEALSRGLWDYRWAGVVSS